MTVMLIRKTKLAGTQEGMVSIVVTMIIMAIISLIVLGFFQVSQREQRQSLDRQLSTQANYAAESGINDVRYEMKKAGGPIANKSTCAPTPLFSATRANLGNGVSYSCLLIDNEPKTLEYNNVDTRKSTIIPIDPGAIDISVIRIHWQDSAGPSGPFQATPVSPILFPVVGSWPATSPGMLRVQLIPIETGSGKNDPDYLATNTFTIFIFPTNAGGVSTNYDSNNTGNNGGKTYTTQCQTFPPPDVRFLKNCMFDINLVTSVNKFVLRVKSIYKSSSFAVQALDFTSTPVKLNNAQARIDSTGNVTDVIQRVSVRVPLVDQNSVPDFALESAQEICKQLQVVPSAADPAANSDSCGVPPSPDSGPWTVQDPGF